MSLKHYGVLKGRVIARQLGTEANAHYQVHILAEATHYRIAINVQSKLSPSELEYVVVDRFQHPVIDLVNPLPPGYHPLAQQAGGAALDYIRANLFNRTQMIPLPFDVPGPDNDLNEKLDSVISAALRDTSAMVYAFGELWGPEPHTPDKIFGFLPGHGIHDIHMNQGNDPRFASQDGTWQDGGLLVHFPRRDRWVGIFLKFQSQTWHTDDVTGRRIEPGTHPTPAPAPFPGEPDGVVRIVAALVNPFGGAPEREQVILVNTLPASVDLTGWAVANKHDDRYLLSGELLAGEARTVVLPPQVALGNKGGTITLLNASGMKVHGVAYTKDEARREGWTLVF